MDGIKNSAINQTLELNHNEVHKATNIDFTAQQVEDWALNKLLSSTQELAVEWVESVEQGVGLNLEIQIDNIFIGIN